MSVPSTKDLQESVEGQEKLLNFIAHAWRTRNWVRVLLVCDAALFIFLNPLLLSRTVSFFNFHLLPWYTAAWVAALILIFVSALVVALRDARSAEQAPVVERRAVKGLRPFAFDDAEIFKRLQRNEILRECLVAITDWDFRLGLISGESGSGKTSFLQAGLCPGLQQHEHRCLLIKFTNQEPLLTIRHALTEQWAVAAEDDGAPFAALIGAATRSDARPVVLLFDQFEQFFIHRRRAERRAFIETLAEWYRHEQTPPIKILICIRSDFSDRLIEMQKVMGYSLGPQESFRLEKFEPEQAVKVFGVIAETEGITFDEGFVAEITSRELASREDGLVSPVDVQILAWMITGHRSLEERAFNRAAYQRLGGVEGLLEKFLKRALAARETEARRQTTIKILLALTNLEQNARAGAMSLEDIKQRLEGSVSPADLEEAVEWLARGDVRLLTPIEQEGRRIYELAHERLIPALRRLAGKELSDADRARQLLDRRVTEWVSSDYDRRYLLSWPELLLIKRHGVALSAVTKKSAASDLLRHSRRRLRLRLGLACAAALLVAASAAWWYSPWGRAWRMERELARLSENVTDSRVHNEATEAFILLNRCERLDEAVMMSEVTLNQMHADILTAVAEACAKKGKKNEVLAALGSLQSSPLLVDYRVKDLVDVCIRLGEKQQAHILLQKEEAHRADLPPESEVGLAEAFAAVGENDKAYELLQEAVEKTAWADRWNIGVLIWAIKAYEHMNPGARGTSFLGRVRKAVEGRPLNVIERAYSSAALAEAYAKTGDGAESLEFIHRALKAADSLMAQKGAKDLFKEKLPKEFLSELHPGAVKELERQLLEPDYYYASPLEHGLSGLPKLLDDHKDHLDSKVRSGIFMPLSIALLTLGESAKDSEHLEQALAAAAWLDGKDYAKFLALAAETSARRGEVRQCHYLVLESLSSSSPLDVTEQVNLIRRLARIYPKESADPNSLLPPVGKHVFAPGLSYYDTSLFALVFNIYATTGDKQKALTFVSEYGREDKYLLPLSNPAGWISIADACLEIGERKKSAEFLERARHASVEAVPAYRAKVLAAVAAAYARLGDWDNAYEYATETGNDIDNGLALAEVLKTWAGGGPPPQPGSQTDGE